jgi:hypothetical protein
MNTQCVIYTLAVPALNPSVGAFSTGGLSDEGRGLCSLHVDREISDELGRSVKGVHRVAMTLGCVGTKQ